MLATMTTRMKSASPVTIVALLDFRRCAKSLLHRIDRVWCFADQFHLDNDRQRQTNRLRGDLRNLRADDAVCLHAPDATLDGRGGQIDSFADLALRRLVVLLQDAQDGKIEAVEGRHGLLPMRDERYLHNKGKNTAELSCALH